MNLGHNNPTYTYHAFRFLGQLYLGAMDSGAAWSSSAMGNDWLSRPKTAGQLVKQWCKWDLEASPVAELITNNFNLSAASTFLNRASDQPIVFGYAVHAPEGNLDAFSNQQARAAMMQWLTRASAEKHWLMVNQQWFSRVADAPIHMLECMV